MAIKASGEHKQKVGFQNTVFIIVCFSCQVNIQIAVDGLKIRDEKTGVRNSVTFYDFAFDAIQTKVWYKLLLKFNVAWLQDCLYHHPVHKISFIAQDMTDNRAFGYIYGSPENGHRFFGIKTEKAAGQVVVAMRDLFQVVFELKKKEIDEAKQNIDAGENESVRRGVHN